MPLNPISLTRFSKTHFAFRLATATMLLALSVVGFSQTHAQDNSAAEDLPQIKLWPGTPPGKIAATQPELDTSGPDGRMVAGKPVIRLGHVSEPMITVYSPPADKNTGAAVIVCPGGGYNILAYDLEGSEVCEWLNTIGVTGVLLKYRVPRAPGSSGRPVEPLQDAQRAMSIVRSKATEWGIKQDRIGVLGFSAGGNLAARLCTNYDDRKYDAIDSVDEVGCRPDFGLLIYPAYLFEKSQSTDGVNTLIADDLPVDKNTPPMFMTMAFDDRVGPENILRFGLAMKAAEVPVSLHLFPTGGHGFGLRKTEEPVSDWPKLAAQWLRHSGWLSE